MDNETQAQPVAASGRSSRRTDFKMGVPNKYSCFTDSQELQGL